MNAALAAFSAPFGLSFSVALRPAASVAVAVVSLIALLTPVIFTVPFAVATMRPPAGAVTLVPIDSEEPDLLAAVAGDLVVCRRR